MPVGAMLYSCVIFLCTYNVENINNITPAVEWSVCGCVGGWSHQTPSLYIFSTKIKNTRKKWDAPLYQYINLIMLDIRLEKSLRFTVTIKQNSTS